MTRKRIYSILILLFLFLPIFTLTTINGSTKVSEFSTPLGNSDYARKFNIQLASKTLNNTIILPDQTFSFNDTIGNASVKNGYKKSKVVVYDKLVDGEGGGVCQLSTTLYNAVEKAGMTIVERHSHTKDIPYIEDGKDATIAYGTKDFKFTNNKDYPLRIKSYIIENNLLVELFAL